MKKIIIILLVLVVVVFGGYFSTGLITERTLKKNLNVLNQANDFSVDLVDYQRGLLQSTANLTWHLQMPEKMLKKEGDNALVTPPKTYTFDMPLVIYHGPVVFGDGHVRFGLGAAHGKLFLPEVYASEFSNVFSPQSTQPELTIKLFVSYLNKTHLELEVPAFQLFTLKDKNQFEWLGMNSDLRFSPESTRLQGHFILDGLRLTGEKFRILLNKLTSEYNIHKADNGLFLGDAKLNLPVLQVTDKKQTEFEVKQLELNSSSSLKNDLFGSSFHAAFKTLLSQDRTYGPGELDVAIKNLNAKVLSEINQQVNQLQQAGTMGNEAQQVLLSLLPKLPRLLEKGAVFEVSTLKLNLPEGALDGLLRITFPQLEPNDAPMQMLTKIEGEGHLNMPATFVKSLLVRSFQQQLIRANAEPKAEPKAEDKDATKTAVTLAELNQQAVHHADQKLADLIQVGVLQAKGADYVLELKLSSGRLLVNGHPFHSGMLNF
ncbi:MAG: YdgA family protein [Legionella sp.]|nr:YdgA family protein [Legionella sp.]